MRDPEWTPVSSYLQRKLQSSITVDDIAYRLRSGLVNRAERETERDKRWAEIVGSPASEHMTVNIQENMSPCKDKPAVRRSYYLRNRVQSTCTETQEQ